MSINNEEIWQEIMEGPKISESRVEKIIKKVFNQNDQEINDKDMNGYDEIIERYVPTEYYHLKTEDSFTFCGIPCVNNEDGRWNDNANHAQNKKPCSKCLKARMEQDDGEYEEDEVY